MDQEDERKAFEISIIYQRRDNAKITNAIIDNEGIKLYLGLDNGIIEEFNIKHHNTNIIARLCAKRNIAKKKIKSMKLIGAVNAIAILTDDGSVYFCDMEKLDPFLLSNTRNGGVTLMTCDPRYVTPCGFATAVRLSSKKNRIDVFEIFRNDNDLESNSNIEVKLVYQFIVQDDIKDINWIANEIIICTKKIYCAINSSGIKKLLSPTTNPICGPLPLSNLITLLWEDHMAVVCDLNGTAARPPLLLDTKPILLTHGGMCIVAICKSGDILIYDQNSSRLVQKLSFPINDIFCNNDDENEESYILHSDTPSGSCVILACSRRVWMLRPVAPQSQTIQLLKNKNYSFAMELIGSCLSEGATWAETAFAQTAILLLHENMWKEAIECFEKCSLSIFQPVQLFPLFPQWTEKWKEQIEVKEYWGLHLHHHHHLYTNNHLYSLKKMILHKNNSNSMYLSNEFSDNDSVLSDNDANPVHLNKIEEIEEIFSEYLMKVKVRGNNSSNIKCIEGIDSLIACLLSHASNAHLLEEFCHKREQNIDCEEVSKHLKKDSRYIALALLYANKKEYILSFDIFKKLIYNEIKEMKTNNGALFDANGDIKAVVTYHMTLLLSDDDKDIDEDLIMKHLAWLKEKSPRRFVQVFQARKLTKEKLDKLFENASNTLKLRYIYDLIKRGSVDEGIHTDYALILLQMIIDIINENVVLKEDEVLKEKLEPKLKDVPEAYFESHELSELNLNELRYLIQIHLLKSKYYKGYEILQILQDTELYKEQVILYCQLKNHTKALRILAITLHDIIGAINYCKRYAGNDGFIALLEILLKPGDNLDPMYTEAIQVLNADSADLDPHRVLNTLPEDTPLQVAYTTLAKILRERTHRRRQTKIIHELRKSQNIQTRAEWYELQSTKFGKLKIDNKSDCVLCGELVGGRIFYRHPSGVIVCGSCQRQLNANNRNIN